MLTDAPNVGTEDKPPPSRLIVAPLLMLRLAPFARVPVVSVSAPPMVAPPPSEMPLARLMVKSLSVTEGREVVAPAPPKIMFDEPLPVRPPPLGVMAPLIVNVCAPIDRAPPVRASCPSTVTSPPRIMPLDRLIVRLFKPTAGSAVLGGVSSKIMLLVGPPIRLPPPALICPLIVSVCAPIDSEPLVSESVRLTVVSPLKETVLEVSTVRSSSLPGSAGISRAVVMGELPVYSTLTPMPNVGAAASEPLLREIRTQSPSVRLPPLLNTPCFSVSVASSGITSAEPSVTPAGLSIMRLL